MKTEYINSLLSMCDI